MRKPERVEMKSGSSHEDNIYANMTELEVQKMKNPKGPPPTKETQNRILLILVALSVLMFLALVIITSLLFMNYMNISEEMSQLKNNVSTSTSELQRNGEDLKNKINTSTSELQRNVNDLSTKLRTSTSELQRNVKDLQNKKPLCESGWMEFGGHCYFFSDFLLNWTNAEKMCLNRESHLVIINSEEEQTFLLNKYKGKKSWIGLTDMDMEGTFKWIDGTGLSYKFWKNGEPNNGGGNEHCAHLLEAAKWNDDDCDKIYNVICEKRLV